MNPLTRRHVLAVLSIALAWGLAASASAAGTFGYRRQITLNGVVGGPHASFPVLVSLVDPNLRTTGNGGHVSSTNGYDIVFTAADGVTPLDHEIERWDAATGELIAWVRVPALSAGTIIFLYYGNNQITTTTEAPAAVWETNYVGVWHMKEAGAGSVDEYHDSSRYGNHGRGGKGANNATPSRVAGEIGYAEHFDNADGTYDFIDAGDDGSLNVTGNQITFEAWVKHNIVVDAAHGTPPASNVPYGILNHKGFNDGYSLWLLGDHFLCPGPGPFTEPCLVFNLPGQTDTLRTQQTAPLGANVWHHVVATYDGATMTVFVDGASEGSRAKTGNVSPSNAEPGMWIGQGDLPDLKPWSSQYEGELDEIRISKTARSANWVASEFANQSNPGAFYTAGAEAPVATSLATLTTNYRSIGVAASPLYSTGDGSVGVGSTTVNFAGGASLPANVGGGDVLTFTGAPAETLYVLVRNSPTQVTLQAPATSAHAGQTYTIARAFGSLVAWEAAQGGNLVAGNRREVGLAYNDGPLSGGVIIDGSTTDPVHSLRLTAAPSQRHLGGAGTGVVVDNGVSASPAIQIIDEYVTVDWLEIKGGSGAGAHGIEFASGINPANLGTAAYNIIHNTGGDGIRLGDSDSIVDLYDNFIYEANYGIHLPVDMSPDARVNIFNNTIYSCNAGTGPSGVKTDVRQTSVRVDLRNNIAHSNANGDFGVASFFDRAYFCNPGCTQIGNGGVLGPTEYLADRTNDFTLNFTTVGTSCLYLGSVSPFRGVDVVMATGGAASGTDLQWSYWNGAWANLETGPFSDGSGHFQYNGAVYWPDDPAGWATTSVSASPLLYYVRACLAAGSYTTFPIEGQIYRSDVSTASRNNLASDITGFPHSYFAGGGTGLDSVPLGNMNFFNTTPGTENLHISAGSAAQDTAADLTRRFALDIDGAIRALPWDIGADDVSATTAVTLQSFAAASGDGRVDLSWTTASELSNLGFHLHRSESAGGPFERITSSLIAGLGSSATGQSYSYRDAGLVNGRTYYYELEDVETTGHTERHGPVSATPNAAAGGSTTPPSPGSTGTTYGDPTSVVLREVERSARHVVLELRTGGFTAFPADGGRVRLHVPGFESASGPGEPSLPMRRAFVEAASGRKVRLTSILATDEVRFPGLRPVSQGQSAIEVSEEGTVLTSEEKRGEGPAFSRAFPTEPALLLGGVFQRETKKAEVLLFPLRWDGSGLTLSRRLLVRLEFTGVEGRETSRGGSRGRYRPDRGSGAPNGLLAQVTVKDRGLYRVDYEDVFPPGERHPRAVPASSLRLSRRGEPVAFHVESPGPGFGPGSSLYFVSEGASLNPYGDAVYELSASGQGLQMGTSRRPAASAAVFEYFRGVVREENHYYQPGLLDAPDLWQWDVVVSPGSKSFSFIVEDLADSPSVGRASVELQGASDFEGVTDHHVRVRVNGVLVGETTWDGKRPTSLGVALEPGVLHEGTNTLELEDVGDAGAAYSMVFLNRFTVSYPRRLVAVQGRLEGRFESTGLAEIEGAAALSFVVDTTDVPRWLTGASATANGLRVPVEAGRSYLVTSSVLRPTVKRLGGSGLRDRMNRADYLLLAPAAFLPVAQPLLDLRKSEGLLTKAVSLEEVSEQFGHGEVSPEAIKEFLEYAYHSWRAPGVRYVLLLGDASYDPKDYLGTGVKDWLPGFPVKTSYLWTVSDPAYASVNGSDLLPDIAIGRLPAGSLDEAQRMVEKILSYENGGGRLDGPAVLVADNADLAGNFEADADEIAGTILAARNPTKIYYSQQGSSTRTKIVEAFDAGASLMSYVGHGGTVVWASENIFNYQDVKTLRRQSRQPFLLTMNCLNGFFHFPPLNSLSEELLKAEGKGVIGAFSPSGLSVNEAAHVFHTAVLREIVSGRHERIGDAILAAQEDYSASGAFPELLSVYNLLGDPALGIR